MKDFLIKYFCLILIVAWGCDNFLQENPTTSVELDNLDEDIVESLLVGMYEPLTRSRGRLWESHWGRTLLLLEEQTVARASGLNEVANYDFTASPLMLNAGWATIYEAIGDANTILELLNDYDSSDLENYSEAQAEAKFVRAFCYFQLVRLYGEVPLRLTPVESDEDTSIPLSDTTEIYDQILTDLIEALPYLGSQTSSPGRATSVAVKVLMADVYLTLHQYQSARDLTEQIIENHESYGYDLVTSLKTLYSATEATNDEDIFSIKFAQVQDQGSFLAVYEAPLSYPEVAAVRALEDAGANEYAPIIRDWDDDDLRKDFNVYNTALVDGEEIEIDMAGNYTLLYGKHRDPDEPYETASGVDYYMYRYADVLLIYAEAENKINGPTDAAREALNKVRRRAYGVNIEIADTLIDLPDSLSQDGFDSLLFRERGYEFMFEGKRWYDLKRTGRWKTIIPNAGKDLPTTLYWPLPTSEIAYNDSIDE